MVTNIYSEGRKIMRNLKAVKQNDLKDCGICCMQWIFMYYDGYLPLEKLREDTLTDSDGTNALYIINAFKKWGFDSLGVLEKNISNSDLKFPAIAHLVLDNGFEHFVVIKDIAKDTIYLMDPSVGYVKMSLEKFQKLFTGHLILATPRNKIIKMDKGLSISDLFWQITTKEKFLISKIIITSIIWSIISILSSYYLKIGTNVVANNKDLLKYVILSFGLLTILKVFFLYIREYYTNHLSNLVDVYLYPEFFKHLFYLPSKNVKTRSSGEVVTRVGEIGNIKSLFSDIFVSCFLDSLLMFISIVILFKINSKLFGILIMFLIIYSIFGIFISKKIYKKVLENINYQTDFNSLIIENIEMFDSIKNLNIIDKTLHKIEKCLAKYLFNNYHFTSFFNITNLGKDFILETCFFWINSSGFWMCLDGRITLVDLFTFNIILSYCIDPIKNIINLLPKYNYVKASFTKIMEFINIPEETISINNNHLKGDIIFYKVNYSYNNYDYILENINFHIKKGSHVLLNAPSGSGKSTICKLLYKEYMPNQGEIFLDNINIRDLDLGTIRSDILYVSQNEELFTGSIKENILIDREINEQEFLQICRICEIESIVSQKQLRYDALIEPASKNISGGEKQRIILARGLLKKASIIILDEALSEVDYKLESQIIKNIQEYFHNKTIIYISHKNQSRNFKEIINLGVKDGIL